MTQNDKQIVRELAKQYMEMALSEKQQKMNQRMRDTNDLKIVRPPVLIDEIPWYQMNVNDELTCLCQDPKAREVELEFRKALYRWKYFRADTIFDPFFRVRITVESTGNGMEERIREDVLRTDAENNIISHSYHDMLAEEEDLEHLKIPEFTLRPDLDEENMNFYTDLLGDAMPVRLCGHNYLYFAPWDRITRYRGMSEIMYDLYDRPEFLHKIMEKYCAGGIALLDFIEKNSHVDPTVSELHCTPGLISGLAEDGWKATWFRGMAQPFSSISPAMHKEFEIDYIKPMAERFAYSYYGCCEPLDNKIDLIKSISNLRKIGVSPWADVNVCAELIGGDYVYARKPNPSHVALSTDPEVVRRETEEAAQACIRNGCPCEFVLKDISTVSHKPENLIVWADTVAEVLDRYYDRD